MANEDEEPKQKRRKRGPKKWTIAQRQGGLLPGDAKREGSHGSSFAALYKRRIPEMTEDDWSHFESQGYAGVEVSLGLDEDQLPTLDHLSAVARHALLFGDSETLRRLADGMDYRRKFLEELKKQKEQPDHTQLELRLYRIAVIYRANHEKRELPTRRVAKRIALDEMITEMRASSPDVSEAALEDRRERLNRSLGWTKAFNALAQECGLYAEKGMTGAPKRNAD